MPRDNLVSISPYPVGHGKNGGGGGTTIIMGGQGSGNSKNLTVHSINASRGNIDNLRVKSLSANDADILYLMTQEGQIIKLKGDTLNYNAGYIGSLQSDEITAKKLNVDDINAVNAWIKTLQSENITTEYLTVTKQAHFFELVIDKIRSVGGQLIISPASCVIDWVWGVTNDGYVTPTAENLSEITAFDVFWRSTEDTGRSVDQEFLPLDQVICQSFNNVSTGVNYDVANKYYWRLVDAVYSNYGYVNLSTGAITQNSQAAINNKYNVVMLATQNKDEFDNYYDNEMIWEAVAQTIQGIQTNVQWQDGTLEEGQAVNGVFSSSSQVYGMRIFPSEDNEQLNITSKLDFIIKQQVGEGFIIPDKINIGIYFTNDTYLVFNNVTINNEGEVTLNLENPNIPGLSEWKLEAPIEEIVIVSTADVNWHLCHRMTISNTDMDDMLSGYASIPSAGDNLVQLGYRGTDDQDRQSAIIISSRPTPDQGGQFDGRTLRPIYPPSYVQYKGIGSKETASENYDLYRFRQSFIDGRGASFVGDISMCTIGGNSIDDTINNIETKSKKILTSASVIQLYTTDNSSSPIRLYPSTLDISIMSPNQNGGTDTYTTVPEGYEIDLIYDRPAGSDTTVVYNAGDSLSGITLITGSQIGEISKLRIFLYKVTGEGQDAQRAMIDSKDLTYMRASTGDAVDGGHTEFRYKNAHTAPNLPANGSDGFSDGGANGWSKMVQTPDIANEIWTWQCQCYVTAEGEYGIWEGPIRITGANGKDGEDGTDIEFIYTRNNGQSGNRPNPPAAPVNDSQGNPVKDQDDWYGTDSNGVTWTDNPVGVAADMKFEYVAQRFKLPGSTEWTAYTTPVVWSNWGVKGTDGDGFEYIFLLSASYPSTQIANPTPNDWNDPNSDYQTMDEYVDYLKQHVPSGYEHWWTDDPESVSQNFPYIYVCKRTKKQNSQEQMVWGQFSDPALWGRYAEQGESGGHYEFRYCNFTPTNDNLPQEPTAGANGVGTYGTGNRQATWGYTVNNPNVNAGEYTYMSQCYLTPSTGGDTYGTWTQAVRITGGNGEDGADGADIEFIYAQKSDIWNNPAAPTVADDPTVAQDDWPNVDGHTPSKTINGTTWYDNPQGVTASVRYEYMAQRIKPRGSNTWGPYTVPVVWSAFGERGQDGDGYEYIYKRSETATALPNPTPSDYATNTTYQSVNEYAPYLSGWSDDPQGVSETYKYEWVSVRTRTNGTWGPFSDPALWSRWAMPGQAGGHWEMRYCNFTPTTGHTTPTKPADGTNGIGTWGTGADAATWARAVNSPDVANGQFTYMTQCFVDSEGSYQNSWTDPFRITGGNGKDGEDGDSIEFIYKHFTSIQTFVQNDDNPAYWAASQTDDYVGPTGHQWTDNPTGVDSIYMYEYVSQRERTNGTWGKFITPVIWSKWGEKGQDGDGFEYIYKLSDTSSTLPNPTPNDYETNNNYQNSDEYAPYLTGWTDDPQGVSESMKFEWVCVRKRTNGTWGPFSDPALWARWAMPGQAGGHWEFRYCNFTPTSGHTTPTKPADGSNGIGTWGSGADAGTWARAVSSPDVDNGQYTYMTQCFVDGSGSYQDSWTSPVRITGGNGKDGEDGDSIEFIYKHFIAEQVFVQNNNNPAYWAASQTDDYTGPSGYQWTDNPTGVDASNMYEYVATRERNNGTWGKFSTPVIWSKWGEKGMDGDGYEYIYKATNSSTAPTKPTNSPQSDDYVPSGWSDDPVSIDATNPYLWVCIRKKNNGTWGSWSNPALWSHYATAESGTPGPPGENAKDDRLICNTAILTAMIKTAISDGNPVNLYCKLDYSMLKIDGTSRTVTSIAAPYKLLLKAYNRNLSMIWSRYVTSDGTATGTPSGSYQKDNLLTEVNPSGSYASSDYRDYMKCYSNTNSTIANRAPIYVEVTLLDGNNNVCDRDNVQVILETGAIFKVIDDDVDPKITAAVATTKSDLQGWVNQKNYATQTWTSEKITSQVGQEVDSRNLVTVTTMNSAITQSANSITQTVSQTYATKESIEGLPTTKIEMVDLTSSSYDRSKFYPCSISLERNRTGYQRIQVQRYLDSSTFGSGPSQWATHSNSSYGFICELDWNTIGCGWGSTWSIGDYQYGPDYDSNSSKKVYPRFINKYFVNWTKSYNGIPANYVAGNICQNPYSTKGNSDRGWADEIVYLRGGSKYKILTDFENSDISVYSSGYSWSGSGASYSAPVKTYTQFKLDTEDAITRTEIRQTVDEISMQVVSQNAVTKEQLKSTGIDIDTDNITLKAGKVLFKDNTGNNTNPYITINNNGELIATGNLTSINDTMMNEISINARNGSILMRGPKSIQSNGNPSSGTTKVDLFKVQFEADSDSGRRVAKQYIYGSDHSLELDGDKGIYLTEFTNTNKTTEKNRIAIDSDEIWYYVSGSLTGHVNWKNIIADHNVYTSTSTSRDFSTLTEGGQLVFDLYGIFVYEGNYTATWRMPNPSGYKGKRVVFKSMGNALTLNTGLNTNKWFVEYDTNTTMWSREIGCHTREYISDGKHWIELANS